MVKAAHAVAKECEKELAATKKHDDEKEMVGGRRRMGAGGFFPGVNGFVHSTLEKMAAAAHIVFTKENIGKLREIVKSIPGDGPFEGMLLLGLDQMERNLPANDPNADLTVESLAAQ